MMGNTHKMYTKLDFTFQGSKCQRWEYSNQVLDKKHQTKLPGIISWNFIWLAYQAFEEKSVAAFDSFTCLEGVGPLPFLPTLGVPLLWHIQR